MPMRYAHEPDVLHQLSLDADNPDHEFEIARVVRLEEGLCEAFDEKIGRSFGDAPVAETRDLTPCASTPRLVVYDGIRTLTGIAVGGSWDGSTWVDGETLTDDAYRLVLRDTDGLWWGIDRFGASWSGVVRVTAIWNDQVTEAVPADVREALTFITVDEYRTRNASPAGEIGPDGMVVPTRNPWNYTLVKEAIDRHRIVRIAI